MNNSPEERLQMLANGLQSTESIRALQLMLVGKLVPAERPEGFTPSKRCYDCQYKQDVAGNAHIECVKPDVMMTGSQHGIQNGWFMYPLLFDPTWMTKECVNFESVSLVRKSNGQPL